MAIEGDPGWRDILYVAICADGSCLPGVVFTSDQSLTVRDYQHIKVLLVENSQAPGADTTMRWLDTSQEYLQDDPVVLIDNLGGHHHKPFLDELENIGVEVHFFPNQGGKYINPCDNSVNSVIRRVYAVQKRRIHAEMLDAIDLAYGAVKEDSIIASFRHCGLTTAEAPAKVVDRLMTQGFLSHGLHRQKIENHMLAYRRWKKNLRHPSPSAAGVAPTPVTSETLPSELDGRYWGPVR